MTRSPAVARRAEALLGTAVSATAPVAGGDIATATRLRLADGRVALMKSLAPSRPGFFAAEARGLAWLADAVTVGGVATAPVLAVAEDCLILEWIEPAKPTAEAAEEFGRRLAATHRHVPEAYGADEDGFIGKLPLPNRPAPTWAEFYVTRRVLPYLKVAVDRGAVTEEQCGAIERLVGRLPDLVPEEGPARLHGDLWNGNVLWTAEQRTYVIDPAAHGGHRETDLAMLALFGMPHLPRALATYHETHPLAEGWEDRVGLHQLFPLLVHAVMFGGSYGERAATIASRYL